jgi:Domain of unknown function (DUF4920)
VPSGRDVVQSMFAAVVVFGGAIGCSNETRVTAAPNGTLTASVQTGASGNVETAALSKRVFGTPLDERLAHVDLEAIAQDTSAFVAHDVVTEGTVTAVCQRRGCWMNLQSAHGEAFVRMAGHAFLVPRDAQGRRARVAGHVRRADAPEFACKLHAATEAGAPTGCKAEAEGNLGHPLAKLELEVTGVELY